MPYLTHPVRRLRDDPHPDERVTLLVTVDDVTEQAALAAALAEHGTVEARLRFGTVRVTVPQPAVAAVCGIGGVDRVETANTLALDPTGAGEDVEPGG
jgi:hypothetical protein